jgi:hypothetical protein
MSYDNELFLAEQRRSDLLADAAQLRSARRRRRLAGRDNDPVRPWRRRIRSG